MKIRILSLIFLILTGAALAQESQTLPDTYEEEFVRVTENNGIGIYRLYTAVQARKADEGVKSFDYLPSKGYCATNPIRSSQVFHNDPASKRTVVYTLSSEICAQIKESAPKTSEHNPLTVEFSRKDEKVLSIQFKKDEE
ncbi:MAG: hypothetical protein JNL01_03855 [Bdellovibrionales bacterium]|nr:hypothetical protein [Bdellovibrionales bacterium]